ncbi:MAG: zf-HC2 domain-containing protein [Acidobacteriota bacterium]
MSRAAEERVGCRAFSDLVSPHVDGELSAAEDERFTTHLPGCAECRSAIEDFEILDQLAQPPVPEVSEIEWGHAWRNIQTAIEADREEAAASPLAPVSDLGRRYAGPWRVLRPVAYLAAAVLLVSVLWRVQQESPVGPPGVDTEPVFELAEADIECAEDYMPDIQVIGEGVDAITVLECIYVGDA